MEYNKLYERARQISIIALDNAESRTRLKILYEAIDKAPDAMLPGGVMVFSDDKEFGSRAFQMGYQFALIAMHPSDVMSATWAKVLADAAAKDNPAGTIDFAAALAKKRQS